MDQFRARFIVHQLMNGVRFKDLRTKIELKDLGLFFEGMGYWAPQTIKTSYNDAGVLTFENDSHVLENLSGSGLLDSRVRFHVDMMKDEARDFVQILNGIVGEFITEYRTEIAKYPELFPSLFAEGHRPKNGAP